MPVLTNEQAELVRRLADLVLDARRFGCWNYENTAASVWLPDRPEPYVPDIERLLASLDRQAIACRCSECEKETP